MAATGTGVLAASNYDDLSPKQQGAIDLLAKDNLLTAKVLGESAMTGLELKTTTRTNTFEVQSGTLNNFKFTGSTKIAETLTIGAKSFANGKINLGKDSLADHINLDTKRQFQGSIQNFGESDQLRVQGKAYTEADVRANGTIRRLDGITFT